MVTQIKEPVALGRKTLSIKAPAAPCLTQRPRAASTSLVYRSMAEKDSAELGAYLRATAGLGNA